MFVKLNVNIKFYQSLNEKLMKTNYNLLNLNVVKSKWKQSFYFVVLLLNTTFFYAQCDQPTQINKTSLTTNGIGFSWTPPATGATSYDYLVTNDLTNYPPIDSETNDILTGSTSAMVTGLNPTITYKIYVRSRCGALKSTWATGPTFTPLAANSGCANAPYGLHPPTTFTPACTGNSEVIVTDAWAGEYSNINVIPNRQYVFTSSNVSDYVAITNSVLTGVIAHGSVPFVWNSGAFSGVLRYYLNTNSTCGTQEVDRVRSVTCQVVPSTCIAPITLQTSSISNTSARLKWSFVGLFTSSQYYVSTSSTTPSINQTPTGEALINNFVTATSLIPNTTYYYWVRSKCGTDVSNWVAGGSFTTQVGVVSGCTGALYGQEPSTPFTPICSGSPEIISTSMWAGQYSNINILANKTYTFTSTVATDFITVRDEITSVAYASGTSPLVWSSGANTTELKVFLNTNSTCGTQNVDRTFRITCQNAVTGCAAPASFAVSAITGSSANISWVAASPTPSNGYQYYYSTSNTAPTAGSTPSGNTTQVLLNLTALNPNTTYYIWVRSNCGASQSNWVFGNNFTTLGANSGCTTALYGQYPVNTFIPTCFGNNEIIVSDAYASEFSNINIIANTQYTFTSSVTSDYITITNTDASVTYIAGSSPLVWFSGSNSGVIRYYFHANSACASQNADRIKYIACQAAPACAQPTGLLASDLTNFGATLNWTAPSPAPLNGYQVYIDTNNITPTASTIPIGSVATVGGSLNGLTMNTTYYYWIRSNCGDSQSVWVSGGSFTTTATSGCTTASQGQFPATTYTPLCSGSTELIVSNAYAGEYASVNILTNKQYTFSSSVGTDFITITNSSGTVVYMNGPSPLVWPSGTLSGAFRYYLHTDSSCGEEFVDRSRFIQCSSALANETFNINSLKLFPNPTTHLLNISSDDIIDSIALFNMLGQLVKEQVIHAKTGVIDMSLFSPATYFLKVTSGDTSNTLKVIKE